MKFMDLAMGQQFELDGEMYVRTGPLVASHAESGKQRFMARYVMVKPSGVAPSEAPCKPHMLSTDTVHVAFKVFHDHCLNLLADLETDLPPDRLDIIRAQLDQARLSFLHTLSAK